MHLSLQGFERRLGRQADPSFQPRRDTRLDPPGDGIRESGAEHDDEGVVRGVENIGSWRGLQRSGER